MDALDSREEFQNFDSKGKTVSQCFDVAFATFDEVCNCKLPTNSLETQYKLKKCMNSLEDITKMVSSTGLFSTNESINEIPTSDIKFLLLPALLGTLVLKLTNGNRREIVQTAEVYFKDFLQRCKDYNLTDAEIIIQDDTTVNSVEVPTTSVGPNSHATGSLGDLMSMARRRAEKIQQFHEEQELESKLLKLKTLMNSEQVDDKTTRMYYLQLIKSYINKAIEDLDCLQSEKVFLNHMSKIKTSSTEDQDKQSKKPYRSKPLQPVIITRDMIQKKVYGAGYPSLPTLTVEELYEQRIKEGTWVAPNAGNTSCLQDMTTNQTKAIQDEQYEIQKETAMENDDPVELERVREMDEYKDTNPRGWGNRYNRS